jgi:hypothetical protein
LSRNQGSSHCSLIPTKPRRKLYKNETVGRFGESTIG